MLREKGKYPWVFQKGKRYVFSWENYCNCCTSKQVRKIPFYEKLDGKEIEIRHSKGGKVRTEAKGLYPAVVFVKPYHCREVE